MIPEGLVQQFRSVALERLARVEDAWVSVLGTLDDDAVSLIHREIHTLKGESRIVGFTDVNLVCHKLEDLFEVARACGYAVDEDFDLAINMALRFMAMLVRKKAGSHLAGIDLPGFIRQIDHVLSEAKGEVTGRSRTAPLHRTVEGSRAPANMRARLAPIAVELFVEYAVARGNRRNRLRCAWHELRDLIGTHRALLGKGQLYKHEVGARELARELGKQVNVTIDIASVEVTTEVLAAVDLAVLHLVRNAVDHGIEAPAERVAAGKPAAGKIQIRGTAKGDTLHLVIEDDGAGIAFDRVRQRAVELGVSEAATDATERWVEMLCHPGLSTRAVATDVSGRGVGLAAVRAALLEITGQLSLSSVPNRTTWTVSVPLTRMQVDGHLVRVPDLPFPVVVEASWKPHQLADGSAPIVDLAALLGLATDSVSPGIVWLVHENCAVGLAAEPTVTRVQARKLVVTPSSTLAEIVTIDGVEGLLLRPDMLIATRHLQ